MNLHAIATSAADDLGYRALADVCSLDSSIDMRIVGGQMVLLLLTAFPSPDAHIRSTADADAAITTQVAASGRVHEALEAAGYTAESGNRYVRDGQTIDLLVPADTSRFGNTTLGGRMFDEAPGLRLAFSDEPIIATVEATLTDGTVLTFTTRLPSVEIATVLKGFALTSRAEPRDIVDIHNLLQIVQHHGDQAIGSWRLGEVRLSGARGDAQRALHRLADTAAHNPAVRASRIPPEVLTALIRTHVGTPR